MKARSSFFEMPKINLRKTRVLQPVQLIVSVVLLIVMLCFFPIEIGAGFGGAGDVRREELTVLMQEKYVPVGCFDRVFQYSAVQNGGLMQPSSFQPSNTDTFFKYDRHMMVNGYHLYTTYDGWKDWTTASQHKSPTGLIVDGDLIGAVDGFAYMDDMKGVYGMTNIDVKEGLYKEDGKPDYATIAKLLERGDREELTYAEAASIYALMQENILIGYADGVAWFADRKESTTDLYRVTRTGAKMIGEKDCVFKEGYVVDNEYLFYNDGEDFHVISLYHDFGLRGGLANKVDEWGKLEQLGYGVVEVGEEHKRVLFVKTEKKLLKLLFSSNSPEYYEFAEDVFDEDMGQMCVTADESSVKAWLKQKKGYHYYGLKVA